MKNTLSTARGVDHIGITVPSIEEATAFFEEAFGAEAIYDMLPEPLSGPGIESGLGVPKGTVLQRIRMLRLGQGPSIELFEYSGVTQNDPVIPTDYGIQHFCVYVDNIHEAAERLSGAGAVLLSEPQPLPGGDAGTGNMYLYSRSPWGSTIELVTYPSPQAYESRTSRRRWRPDPPAASALAGDSALTGDLAHSSQ
ncbi:VOC family protein [Paenarthrobacter ureafaciens]|uniref:VOC family protein n=1 Tax=Paenarthrobacter ureafaciens TaxID=37931 RepID=UPI002DB9F543|nr:VOC family protein [Paenarthrobacter ureafaciens]MEC3853699.1 VOC family protein [Paenarthrobacter ureafaciens]